MHRDLKPTNILLSKNKHVRITDFGLTKEDSLETSQSKGVGTFRFMAPELFEDDGDENQPRQRYSNKVDVYSFGITLIYLITESYPNFSLKNVVNGIAPKLPSAIVPWVAELINHCLQASGSNRPTFNEIFEIITSHDFDLFNETKPKKLTSQERRSKEEIKNRILKIQAFEYQVQLSKSSSH